MVNVKTLPVAYLGLWGKGKKILAGRTHKVMASFTRESLWPMTRLAIKMQLLDI